MYSSVVFTHTYFITDLATGIIVNSPDVIQAENDISPSHDRSKLYFLEDKSRQIMMFLNHSSPSGILFAACRMQNGIFMAPLTLIATSEMNDAALHLGKVSFSIYRFLSCCSSLHRIISASVAD